MRALLVILTFFVATSASAQHTDIRILRDIHVKRNTALDPTFDVITNSATPIAISVPMSFLASGFIQKDTLTFMNGVTMVGGLAICSGITLGMKYGINRDRPFVTFPEITGLSPAGSPSFPSGHTSTSFTLATNLTLAYPKWWVATPAYLWAGAVGYSRMHLGVHYPSDVLVGAMVGAGSAWLSHVLTKRFFRQ